MSVIALRSDAPSLDEEAHKETIAHPFDPFVKTRGQSCARDQAREGRRTHLF